MMGSFYKQRPQQSTKTRFCLCVSGITVVYTNLILYFSWLIDYPNRTTFSNGEKNSRANPARVHSAPLWHKMLLCNIFFAHVLPMAQKSSHKLYSCYMARNGRPPSSGNNGVRCRNKTVQTRYPLVGTPSSHTKAETTMLCRRRWSTIKLSCL